MRCVGARAVVGIVLAGATGFGAAACVRNLAPQMLAPVPPELRAQIHHIAILGPPPPRFFYEKSASGAGWGYLRGMGGCFGGALAGGGAVGKDALGAAAVLAAGIVGCPTIGGLVGAVRNPSDSEVAEARVALERVAGEATLDAALRRDLAAQLARGAPRYEVALWTSDRPDQPLPDVPVDTVLTLENLRVTLLHCGEDYYIVPPLTLYAIMDAQLRQADTRAVLHTTQIEYWGEETFSFQAWGASGGEHFALGLGQARASLVEQLVQSFFVAQVPLTLRWPPCRNQSWRARGAQSP
jgi:hypothetical protein